MKRFMLDMNTVSYLIKAHPSVVARVRAVPMASFCISAITEGELQFALARRPTATRLACLVREFLLRVDVRPWGRSCALTYGKLSAGMEVNGRVLGSLDLLIAAHAMDAGLTLVSSDHALKHVPNLQLEDWTG